jgi:hypothetical protein
MTALLLAAAKAGQADRDRAALNPFPQLLH